MALDINNFLYSRQDINTTAKQHIPTKHFYKTTDTEEEVSTNNYFFDLLLKNIFPQYARIIVGDLISVYFIPENRVELFLVKEITGSTLVTEKISEGNIAGVATFNGRYGDVTTTPADLQAGQPNGAASLDGSGKLVASQIPTIPNVFYIFTGLQNTAQNVQDEYALRYNGSQAPLAATGMIQVVSLSLASNIPLVAGSISLRLQKNLNYMPYAPLCYIAAPSPNNLSIVDVTNPIIYNIGDTLNTTVLLSTVQTAGLARLDLSVCIGIRYF